MNKKTALLMFAIFIVSLCTQVLADDVPDGWCPSITPGHPDYYERPIRLSPGGGSDYYAEVVKPLWIYQIERTDYDGNKHVYDSRDYIESAYWTKRGYVQDLPTLLDDPYYLVHYPDHICPPDEIPEKIGCYITVEGFGNGGKHSCGSLASGELDGKLIIPNDSNGSLDSLELTRSTKNGIYSIGSVYFTYGQYNNGAAGALTNCTSLSGQGPLHGTCYPSESLWKGALQAVSEGKPIKITQVETFRVCKLVMDNGVTKQECEEVPKEFEIPLVGLTDCYHAYGDGPFNVVVTKVNNDPEYGGGPGSYGKWKDNPYAGEQIYSQQAEIAVGIAGGFNSVDPFAKYMNRFSFSADLGGFGSCGGPSIDWRQTNSPSGKSLKVSGNVVDILNPGWVGNSTYSVLHGGDTFWHAIGHAFGFEDSYINPVPYDSSENTGSGKNCVDDSINAFVFDDNPFGFPAEFCRGGKVAASCPGGSYSQDKLGNVMGFSSSMIDTYGGVSTKFNNIEAAYMLKAFNGGEITQDVFEASPPVYDDQGNLLSAGMNTIRQPTSAGIRAVSYQEKTNVAGNNSALLSADQNKNESETNKFSLSCTKENGQLVCTENQNNWTDQNNETPSCNTAQKQANFSSGTNDCPTVNFGSGGTTVKLAWDPPIIPEGGDHIVNYRLYVGPASKVYTNVTNLGVTTMVKLENMSSDVHYFAVTAVASNGLESNYSEEVSFAAGLLLPKYPNVRDVKITFPYLDSKKRQNVLIETRRTPNMTADLLGSTNMTSWEKITSFTSRQTIPITNDNTIYESFAVLKSNNTNVVMSFKVDFGTNYLGTIPTPPNPSLP